MKCIITLILLALLTSLCIAQQPNYIHFDDSNGLLDFEEYDLFQDKDHYVWIAGNSGLERYNGKEFVHYSSLLQTGRSLTNIRQDMYGRIWCHDFTGKLFYIEHGTLQLFNWKSSSTGTFPVFEITGGYLWIITPSEIQVYQIAREIGHFRKIKTISLKNSKTLIEYNGNYYLSGLNSIYKIDKNFKIQELKIEGTHLSEFLNAWCSFVIIKNKLQLLTRQEKMLYELKDEIFEKKFSFSSFPDIISFRNVNGQCWLLTQDGAHCLNSDFSVKYSLLTGLPVSDVITDYEGNHWFSTLNQGIFLVPDLYALVYKTPNEKGFTRLKKVNNDLICGTTDGCIYSFHSDSLVPVYKTTKNKEVSFITESDGRLLFGNKDFISLDLPRAVKILGINPPFKQFEKINDEFYLAADPGGLYLYSLRSDFPDSSLVPNFLRRHIKKTGIYNKGQEQRQIYMLINERTNAFYAGNHFILAATKGGLLKIDSTGISKQIKGEQLIYATAFAGNDSCVFVATANAGLLKYVQGKWQAITELNKERYSIYIQNIKLSENNVWIATDEGIIIYNLLTKNLHKLGKEEGLLTTKINDMCVFEKQMFIATSKGMISFPLNIPLTKNISPAVFLREVTSDNGTIEKEANRFMLAAGTKSIQLKFDVLSYNNQNNYQVLYKQENEKNFMASDPGEYQILITSLEPGPTNFDIQIRNKYTHKLIYSDKVKIIVAYAFYETWYFKCGILAIIFTIFLFILRRRIRFQNKRNAELLEKERLLKELKQSMLSSIKAQMNPHFIFNSLNTIQSYILSNDKLKANFYLGRFSDLMRKILSMSNSELIKVEEEKEAIELYLELENMRLNGELHYTVEMEDEEKYLHKKIPSMIIQPFVENAIKHGLLHYQGEKILRILFFAENNILTVSIRDYGIGRKAAEKMKNRLRKKIPSFSSEANKKRLELLNENADQKIVMQITDLDATENKTGTLVVLKIPLAD